jgi:sugar/nucleoside kinase (ribokinase family)
VITGGANGAKQYWRENGEVKVLHQPAIPVQEVVDTTGAGDSFLAGYIKALIDSVDKVNDPMLIGAHWSALAVSMPGSQPPDWSSVKEILPNGI